MVRIAPIRLQFNPKTLWFDAGELDLSVGDKVVVSTARGTDFGSVSKDVFEMAYEDSKKLKSPLKPVKRIADEDDIAKAEDLAQRGIDALPTFKALAAEVAPDMNPVAVEFLFEGDKAVFYFESEERVDFRDLVRKLAAEFHVRVDMKQIGVRDEARMVGGLGHCGQELCCRRLGGEFNPVSIRMAKEQDLSLNPQKISGICGRLMCCLRYEYDAYKDFHSRAPKKNAKIETPDGEGKVVDMNVPREIISIKVGDDKPVKVPLSDMDPAEEGARPNSIGQEAWDRANEPPSAQLDGVLTLFSTTQLSGEDKLAEPGKIRRVHGDDKNAKPRKSRSRRRGGKGQKEGAPSAEKAAQPEQRKGRRRRSTTLSTSESSGNEQVKSSQQGAAGDDSQPKRSSSRRRSRNRSQARQTGAQAVEQQAKSVKVGRNSSALRSHHDSEAKASQGAAAKSSEGQAATRRRRRRSHKPGSGEQGDKQQQDKA